MSINVIEGKLRIPEEVKSVIISELESLCSEFGVPESSVTISPIGTTTKSLHAKVVSGSDGFCIKFVVATEKKGKLVPSKFGIPNKVVTQLKKSYGGKIYGCPILWVVRHEFCHILQKLNGIERDKWNREADADSFAKSFVFPNVESQWKKFSN